MPDPQEGTDPRTPKVPTSDGRTLPTLHGRIPPVPVTSDQIRTLSLVATDPVLEMLGQTIGGYVIEGELGRGGMGVVYKARQKGLGRLVALKMILHADHAGAEERARFEREAKALAELRHESIVQVYEVGEHQGKPFFSLEYVDGGALDRRLRDGPLPAREAAALVETLAGAMQVAHEKGIVHRDLKPANVLLQRVPGLPAERAVPPASRELCGVPKITDFGLAKKQDEGNLSVSGAVLGTPSYMAPEQAAGKIHAIDGRTDVYALGAILYECLTGRPPFQAATALDTLLQVIQDEPVAVRSLQPVTPPDLETICLKCLRKEPARRYALARELAEDLGRFLRGEPVLARPVGRLECGWRWCRRNLTTAGLLAGIALLLVIVATVSTVLGQVAWRRAEEAAHEARRAQRAEEGQKQKTEEEKRQRQRAEELVYIGRLSLAQSYWQEGNVAAARDKLDETREHRDCWEHRYLYTLMYHRGQRTFQGHTGSVSSVCVSPDGQRLASGSWDRTVRVWDAATGQQALSLQGHTGNVSSVCFSPDGKRLASGSWDRTVKVWDAHTGQQTLSLQGHTSSVTSVCFSPDGQRLVSGSYDQTVKVWEAQTGQEALSLNRLTSGKADRPAPSRWWVDPDYRWHAEQAEQAWRAGDWFAAAFHLNRQLPARPWDAGLRGRHAYALARLGRTTQATADYLQTVLLNPRLRLWPLDPDASARGQRAAGAGDWPGAVADLELAAHQPGATLATGSDLLLARLATAPKGAQLNCRDLLNRFESNAGASWQLGFSCRVAACDEADARRLVKVAERLVAGRRDAATLDLLGSALYRAGRFEEAARILQDSRKVHGKGGFVDTCLFLAMVQQRLGRGAEARGLLTRFETWLKTQRFATWQATVRWRLLHEEARGLILTMPQGKE